MLRDRNTGIGHRLSSQGVLCVLWGHHSEERIVASVGSIRAGLKLRPACPAHRLCSARPSWNVLAPCIQTGSPSQIPALLRHPEGQTLPRQRCWDRCAMRHGFRDQALPAGSFLGGPDGRPVVPVFALWIPLPRVSHE